MTTRSEDARSVARRFEQAAGLSLIPEKFRDQFREKVLLAYLEWVKEEKPDTSWEPGSLALLEAQVTMGFGSGSIVTLALPCRVEGWWNPDRTLRMVVIEAGDVPLEYRAALEGDEGWWSTGGRYVTVAAVGNLKPRATGPVGKVQVERWDPLSVVISESRVTIRDVIEDDEDEEDADELDERWREPRRW